MSLTEWGIWALLTVMINYKRFKNLVHIKVIKWTSKMILWIWLGVQRLLERRSAPKVIPKRSILFLQRMAWLRSKLSQNLNHSTAVFLLVVIFAWVAIQTKFFMPCLSLIQFLIMKLWKCNFLRNLLLKFLLKMNIAANLMSSKKKE